MVDAGDLKSPEPCSCGFESHRPHQLVLGPCYQSEKWIANAGLTAPFRANSRLVGCLSASGDATRFRRKATTSATALRRGMQYPKCVRGSGEPQEDALPAHVPDVRRRATKRDRVDAPRARGLNGKRFRKPDWADSDRNLGNAQFGASDQPGISRNRAAALPSSRLAISGNLNAIPLDECIGD